MRLDLAAGLSPRRRLPSAIGYLGTGETSFLCAISADTILSVEQMYVLARYEILHIAGYGPKQANPCPVSEILIGDTNLHPGRAVWSRKAGAVVRDITIFSLHEEAWSPHEIDRQCVFMGMRPIRSKGEIRKSCFRAKALGQQFARLAYWNYRFERWGFSPPNAPLHWLRQARDQYAG